MPQWWDVKRRNSGRQTLTQLPPKVRSKDGSYYYDHGKDESGVRKWTKLCRHSDGEHALYKALAEVTNPRIRTCDDLFNGFLASNKFKSLAPATQKDYAGYIKRTLRPVFGHCRQESGGIADGGHDLAARLGQQPDQALPQQDRVVSHHNPHGRQDVTSPPTWVGYP